MSCKNLFLVLLYGHFLALYTVSSRGLIDAGASCDVLQSVSVQISGTDIECDKNYPLSLVGNQEQPKFRFAEADEGSLYVVTMIDPDAPFPSDAINRSWLHFMVINVQGKDLKSGNIPGNGHIVIKYQPPSPPEGIHRYITLVLEQSGKLTGISINGRMKFNIDKFAKHHGLEAVGSNMFKAER